MFDLNTYIKSQAWENNEFLVQHPTGIKRCECCNNLLFSCEFAEHDAYPDGKLPSCSRCCRKHKKEPALALVDKLGITVTCKKCQEEKALSNYVQRAGDWTEIGDTCYDCRNEYLLTIR